MLCEIEASYLLGSMQHNFEDRGFELYGTCVVRVLANALVSLTALTLRKYSRANDQQ